MRCAAPCCLTEGEAIGLRVSILASGSSGNITLLETEHTRLLIDAGLGKRETLARLAAVEKEVDHLDGILITHEHSDHCNGLPQMLGMWKAPLYVTLSLIHISNCRFMASLGTLKNQVPGLEQFAFNGREVRVHSVDKDSNPGFWRLLHKFGETAPAPVLVNTSFNLFGEPLVSDPREAVRSFYCSGIDALALGSFLVVK